MNPFRHYLRTIKAYFNKHIPMRNLYPITQPSFSGTIEVGQGHKLYAEESGNPKGIPVVFLHGGPGSGCRPDHRQFFDPDKYRVFLFDQRGAGRSTPKGDIENNTTWLLLEDLESIRKHFKVEKWVLFGGSWGATLALLYAEAHATRVLGCVLRGSFLARAADMSWFFGDGAQRLLPQSWERFSKEYAGHRKGLELAKHLYSGLLGTDQEETARVAKAWDTWSAAVVMFSMNSEPAGGMMGDLQTAISRARIEMHYAVNSYFIEENHILNHISQFPSVPTHIIHGGRDITCLPEAGWQLHKAIVGSTFEVLRTGGHLSGEKELTDALIRATDNLAQMLA